jgi:ribosomal protein S19
MEKESIIIRYISAWNWHLLGIIFLVGSLIVISTARDFINLVIYAALMIGFILCEFIAYQRREKIEKEDSNES